MTDRKPQKSPISQTLADKILEFSPDGILVTREDGRIAEVNAQIEKMFGYTRTELLAFPVETLIPERIRDQHRTHRASYNAQPTERSMGIGLELHGRRKDGSEFPVDIMLSPLEVSGEIHFLAVVRDVTERKRMESALGRSEEDFRLLVEGVKDYGIFMLDRSGLVVSWNAGAQLMKGYAAEEIIGHHFSQFYMQEDIDSGKPARELDIAAAQGKLEDEGWRVRKDGSRFWANVVITAIRDKTGEVVGFSKVIRDFTDRKRAEQALQISERRFRALYEFSPDAILVTGQDGEITEANSQAERFFGYTRAELLGKRVEILIPERFRKAHPGHRKQYHAHPRTRTMGAGLALYGRRNDGSEFPVDIMLSTVDTGANRMVLSVIRDLSEKVRAQEELERREQEKHYLENELYTENRFEDIVGESQALRAVLKLAETVAATDVTVLILGETGTGKDLIARAIHQLSRRNQRSLIKLNCAAIPTGLLESELFGHERGAFTGAISQKIGRLEMANQGMSWLSRKWRGDVFR